MDALRADGKKADEKQGKDTDHRLVQPRERMHAQFEVNNVAYHKIQHVNNRFSLSLIVRSNRRRNPVASSLTVFHFSAED